jgi:DNA primase
MTIKGTSGPEPRDTKDQWLDAESLKSVSVRAVLEEYGLLKNMTERGPTMNGPSPLSEGGVLSINLEKNVWNDSWGRPEIDGRPVPGNVIGLVQAIERVSFRRALEILSQRFAQEPRDQGNQTREQTAAVLRQESVEAKREGNTPFGKELKGLKADVPFLQEAGISPELAKAWGVGWCSRGLLRGRIAFPIRRADGMVMAYVGLSPKAEDPEGLWRFPSGFQRSLELFGIDRIHADEVVRQQALEHGLTLADDPLEVLRLQQDGVLTAVSPMGSKLSAEQIAMLLDPKINPTGRLTLAGKLYRYAWATDLIRRAWVRYAGPSDDNKTS